MGRATACSLVAGSPSFAHPRYIHYRGPSDNETDARQSTAVAMGARRRALAAFLHRVRLHAIVCSVADPTRNSNNNVNVFPLG